MCKHIWYKEFSMEGYTKFYCMKCLKRIKVTNFGNKTKAITIPKESDEIIEEVKEKCNWEENTTGLTFQDFKYAIKKVLDNEDN